MRHKQAEEPSKAQDWQAGRGSLNTPAKCARNCMRTAVATPASLKPHLALTTLACGGRDERRICHNATTFALNLASGRQTSILCTSNKQPLVVPPSRSQAPTAPATTPKTSMRDTERAGCKRPRRRALLAPRRSDRAPQSRIRESPRAGARTTQEPHRDEGDAPSALRASTIEVTRKLPPLTICLM